MNSEVNLRVKHDIHERIYDFVLRVILFTNKLSRSYVNQCLINQLVRSATSMGANDQEANGAFTRADFIHCYTLVRKEGNESIFWIRLIGDCNLRSKDEAGTLRTEGDEIVRIVTAIIYNTKNKVSK